MPFSEIAMLVILLALAAYILVEDLRRLEIPAWPVLTFTGLSLATGIAFPLSGLFADHALAGMAAGLALAGLTRGYIHLRTGHPAFGGADVALIGAGGALLGPSLLGPWILGAIALAALLSLAPHLGRRASDLEGEILQVLPFCPALLLSLLPLRIAAATGFVPALPFL